jgi:hypothetical protein
MARQHQHGGFAIITMMLCAAWWAAGGPIPSKQEVVATTGFVLPALSQ